MNDRPDVTITARYELADSTTAADLTELLLTVPADARITFSVPSPPVQSYAVAEVSPPRALLARWTVPAGQPLTPPNVDETPAAGWSDRPVNCPCTVEPVRSEQKYADKGDTLRPHARGCTLDTDHRGPCKPPFASGGIVHGLAAATVAPVAVGTAAAREAAQARGRATAEAARHVARLPHALDLGGTGL